MIKDWARRAVNQLTGHDGGAARASGKAPDGLPPPPPPDADTMTMRLDQALRRMRSLDRNIFLVSRLDHMPDDEIARHTGLSVEQVRRRMLKTMLRLRRVMDGEPVRWWWRLC